MARLDDELLYEMIAEGGDQGNEEINHSQANMYLNLAGDGIEPREAM
jgi:hypothetical protein